MKRLLLFIAIAGVIGIGILVLQPNRQTPERTQEIPINMQNTPQRNAQPSEAVLRSIIPNIIGSEFDAATATYTLANIDNEQGYELIVGAVEQGVDFSVRPVTASLHVVTLLSEQGDYEHLGRIDYQEWVRGVPAVKELKDITGDKQPEVIISLQYGGASSWAQGIMHIDIQAKQVGWVQMQTQNDQTQDAVFILASSAAHHSSIEFIDTNTNGLPELVELFSQTVFDETQCMAVASEWNGRMFVYSEQLSQQIQNTLSATCEL